MKYGAWSPADESNLEAWYKYQTGITLNGSDVSAWADSSSNSFNMVQATASEQPAYNSGAIQFTAADTHNLGSATHRWANLHTGDIQLSNEGTEGNEVDGTTGSWTIQEGEDDLYLLNRKNGKKYKFKLEEIT